MPGPIMTAPRAAAPPGWYGKLPALGDFASRRLPPDFLAPWDAWLQRQVRAGRALLGERWEAAYLAGAPWRFLLLPGACGPGGWTGLLTPSRDKVGRCFPLTIALAFEAQPEAMAGVFAAGDWFDALEAIALAARDGATSPEQFDAALLETPCIAAAAQPAGAACAPAENAAGRTLWWQKGEPGMAAPLLACCALPPDEQAGLLLANAR